jgi:hypothetical protein
MKDFFATCDFALFSSAQIFGSNLHRLSVAAQALGCVCAAREAEGESNSTQRLARPHLF